MMRSFETPQAAHTRYHYLSIGIKMQLVFTVLFAIIFVVVFRGVYLFSTNLASDGIKRDLTTIANYTAASIDGDEHQALYQSPVPGGHPRTITDARYWNLIRELVAAQHAVGIIQLPDGSTVAHIQAYTYVAIDPPGTVTFVGSSLAGIYLLPDGRVNTDTRQRYAGTTFRDRYRPQTDGRRTGVTDRRVKVTHSVADTKESWYSAFAPIHDKQGRIVGTVGIDMVVPAIDTPSEFVWWTIGPIFVESYVILFIAVSALSYAISRPLVRLTKRIKRVGDGDYAADVVPTTREWLHDETTVLTQVFHQMVDKVAAREQHLVQQVQDLKIVIDQDRQDQQVEEITETDYFHDLQRKARQLRARAALDETNSDP